MTKTGTSIVISLGLRHVPYLSIPNCFDFNAIRHLRRAQWHMVVGKYDYAMGSISKAVRNFARADEFRRPFNTKYRVPAWGL